MVTLKLSVHTTEMVLVPPLFHVEVIATPYRRTEQREGGGKHVMYIRSYGQLEREKCEVI